MISLLFFTSMLSAHYDACTEQIQNHVGQHLQADVQEIARTISDHRQPTEKRVRTIRTKTNEITLFYPVNHGDWFIAVIRKAFLGQGAHKKINLGFIVNCTKQIVAPLAAHDIISNTEEPVSQAAEDAWNNEIQIIRIIEDQRKINPESVKNIIESYIFIPEKFLLSSTHYFPFLFQRLCAFPYESQHPWASGAAIPNDESLRQIVTSDKHSPPATATIKEATNTAKQITHGLKAIHDLNIVHGDLKWQNILATDALQIKIIDFGISSSLHHIVNTSNYEKIQNQTSITTEAPEMSEIVPMNLPEFIAYTEKQIKKYTDCQTSPLDRPNVLKRIIQARDVYAFGIMLASHYFPTNLATLQDACIPLAPNSQRPYTAAYQTCMQKMAYIIREKINENCIQTCSTRQDPQACLFEKIILSCLHPDPICRPEAKDLHQALEMIQF